MLVFLYKNIIVIFFSEIKKMSKRRKNSELPENVDNLKIRNEELEDKKLMLMARILELETSNELFEKEIRELKENCKCPKVKMCYPK